MNSGNGFELQRELRDIPPDSVHPMLRLMGTSLAECHMNHPRAAEDSLCKLIAKHQQEMGPDNTFNMEILREMLLIDLGEYQKASVSAEGMVEFLRTDKNLRMVMDSTAIHSYIELFNRQLRQAKKYAEIGNICRPLHPKKEYRIPFRHFSEMHIRGGHLLTLPGRINETDTEVVFDTGAGANIISPQQAAAFGVRRIGVEVTAQGVGNAKAEFAIADTLRIGDMAWQNVPFVIVDGGSGHAKADSLLRLLPPVVGIPIMRSMEEMQLDFENSRLIVPAVSTPRPFKESNLLLTSGNNSLQIAISESSNPLQCFHFDTGGYPTVMPGQWYEQHRKKVEVAGICDSLRAAGIGGTVTSKTYKLPDYPLALGNGKARLDTLFVDTNINPHTGMRNEKYIAGTNEQIGVIGLGLLERFKRVIINLKDMYIEGIE